LEKQFPTPEEEMPTSAALTFIKGASTPARANSNEGSAGERRKKKPKPKIFEKKLAEPKPKLKEREATRDQKVFGPQYVALSTKLRKSVKRELAELAHARSMEGHSVRSIKQFIEAALTQYFKTSGQKNTERMQTCRSTDDEPLLPFNNQIRADLKRKLLQVSHDREMEGHPVQTIIAIVDDALTLWLDTRDQVSRSPTRKSVS